MRKYMMAERAKASDFITPREINQDVAELYSEWNGGLDSENFAAEAIDGTCIQFGAIHELFWDEDTVTETVTKAADSTTTGWVDIPVDEGIGNTAFPGDITTTDCMLEIITDGTYEMSSTNVLYADEVQVSFAILVDGRTVTMTEGNVEDSGAAVVDPGELNVWSLVATVPVGAGAHRVGLAILLTAADGAAPQQVVCDVNERCFIVRAVKR